MHTVAAGAEDEAEADDSVQHDHDGGVDGVAGYGLTTWGAREQDGDDQADLDDGHRDGEEDGAEGFAEAQGDDLGVVDGREDGAAEEEASEKLDGDGIFRGDAAELQAEEDGGEDGDQPRPCGDRVVG